MSVKLSIIIPSYNNKIFLSDCINSIFFQIDSGVEVILIDDGSSDGTNEFVLERYYRYIESGSLVYIYQENKGVSASRNLGLDIARGEYITFLDADDFFFAGLIDSFKIAESNYIFDVYEHGFLRFHEKNKIEKKIWKPLYKFHGIKSLKNIRDEFFSKTVWFPSIRIYKRDLWLDLRFPFGMVYEDTITIPKIYEKDITIYFSAMPFLGYRYNKNSTTSSIKYDHLNNLLSHYRSVDSSASHWIIFKLRLLRSIVNFSLILDAKNVDYSSDWAGLRKKLSFKSLRYFEFTDLLFYFSLNSYIFLYMCKNIFSKFFK